MVGITHCLQTCPQKSVSFIAVSRYARLHAQDTQKRTELTSLPRHTSWRNPRLQRERKGMVNGGRQEDRKGTKGLGKGAWQCHMTHFKFCDSKIFGMDGARHFKAGVPVGAVLRSPYLYVCLSVCLLACLRNACPSFLHVLPAAVAWSSSNDNTIDRIK